MNWYYVEDNQQRGPISEAELGTLIETGKVTPTTLVWREGLANWQPLAEAMPGAASRPGVAATPQPVAAAPVSTDGTGDEVVCGECGRLFPRDQTIQYGNAWVCATCKPIFVQKLKEGAALSGPAVMEYAGFWIRFAAYIIDQIILGMVNWPIQLLLGVTASVDSPEAMLVRQLVVVVFGLLLSMVYYTWFNGKYGATPGKMACRIRIVTAEGMPIGYSRACGRYFASILSGMICSIGYIMAAFDDEKRALHDRICNTRVVRR